jgi:hypothetical protein
MIKQPTDTTGCGVAVIAMLRGDEDFKSAMNLMEPHRDKWFKRKENMTNPQMKDALEELMAGFHVDVKNKRPHDMGAAALYVRVGRYKHWIAFDGTCYFDPLSTAGGPTTRMNMDVSKYLVLRACKSDEPKKCNGC